MTPLALTATRGHPLLRVRLYEGLHLLVLALMLFGWRYVKTRPGLEFPGRDIVEFQGFDFMVAWVVTQILLVVIICRSWFHRVRLPRSWHLRDSWPYQLVVLTTLGWCVIEATEIGRISLEIYERQSYRAEWLHIFLSGLGTTYDPWDFVAYVLGGFYSFAVLHVITREYARAEVRPPWLSQSN